MGAVTKELVTLLARARLRRYLAEHSHAEDDCLPLETGVATGAPVRSCGLSVRSERSGDHPNLYSENNPRAERPDAR